MVTVGVTVSPQEESVEVHVVDEQGFRVYRVEDDGRIVLVSEVIL